MPRRKPANGPGAPVRPRRTTDAKVEHAPGSRPPRRGDYPSPTQSREYRYMLDRLRATREALGLSQAEVGRQLGRSDQFVSKSETGERRLDPIDLLRFARVYQQPVDHFLPADPAA